MDSDTHAIMVRMPGRGHEALRRGRSSAPKGEYFLTFCTGMRKSGLTELPVLSGLLAAVHKLHADGVWKLRTGVVMPDHVHLLVVLCEAVTLSDAVRLFKGPLTPLLRKAEISWQPAYFDHWLRPDEDRLPIFLYIFLNPYRAELLPLEEKWPGYFCCEEDWVWLEKLTDADSPMPEWLP